MINRKNTLQNIKDKPQTTVLIIGAGINGIGTFRDLALQGVDCLIVDKEGFCSGASTALSHMLHGGIRYLENGEFRLVKEALHERNNLLRNAPHLTHPLPTTNPIFKWLSGIFNSPLKFLIENEMVTRLDNLVLRRTKTSWVGKVSEESLVELAAIIGDNLGWTAKQKIQEKERALALLREKHAVRI